MNISIFGLGYVGCVGAACCAKLGHRVIGVDIAENKVALMNEGRPTIIEAQIDSLISAAHHKGLLEATTDAHYAIQNSDLSFIAVGTPSTANGHLNLDYIFAVAKQIGEALREKNGFHTIVIRSTVLPGTNEKIGELVAEISNKATNEDFAIVSNPEFLREGTAVDDYLNPPFTLVGTANHRAETALREVYRDIPGDFIVTDIAVAEIMKYVNNTYHALKVVFANEVGNVCKALDIDSHKVMEIFCQDTRLNLSPYYFKPGFAYGGSCLPKDMKAFRTLAHDLYVDVPVIGAIEASNELQKHRALEIVESKGKKKIGVFGLSFKPGTDDLRASPAVDLVESLVGKGYEIRIYDKFVRLSQLTGTNADFIAAKLPHLHEIITDDMDAVADFCEVIVVANREKELMSLPERYPDKPVVDLVRQYDRTERGSDYEGLSWGK